MFKGGWVDKLIDYAAAVFGEDRKMSVSQKQSDWPKDLQAPAETPPSC